ncbi:MAG TPA: iron-sulfur cluster assembly scaffold protein [Armatimonadetes bacterium]|nr:iron-sulfur cluster assembly scaffold protein [Armatimonadota bacterium]
MQYSAKVMDHFENPRNVGVLEDANAIGEVGNPRCGDIMKITMRINEETDVVEDINFQTFGCGAAIAVSSILTEMVKGKTLEDALKVGNTDVVSELDGLPAVKVHCSVLGEEGVAAAAKYYYERHPEKTPPASLAEKIARLAALDVHEEGS